jgi:hypothetical protein
LTGSATGAATSAASSGVATSTSASASGAIPGTALTRNDVADLSDPSVSTVGSPAEKALIQQIVGAVNAQQTSTHDMSPDVADLVLGPMLRGTEVSFR